MIVDQMNTVYEKATCVFDSAAIEGALDKMAAEMTETLKDSNPLFLCVMVGGVVTTGQLMTRLHFPLELDYIHATRYRGETTGGHLHWKVRPATSLADRTVVIVDDILDGGITLTAIVDYCRAEGAKEVKTAVLLDKTETRVEGGVAKADFTGLEIANGYVMGYGMDYKEYWRNLPAIYVVAPEHQ